MQLMCMLSAISFLQIVFVDTSVGMGVKYLSNVLHDMYLSRFLGHFQPQQGKPALWELDSDQHHNIGIHDPNVNENSKYCRWS